MNRIWQISANAIISFLLSFFKIYIIGDIINLIGNAL